MKQLILLTCFLSSVVFANDQPGSGLPVDKYGGQTVDPTRNVLDLVQAAVKRLDDLREQAEKYQKEISDLRATHENELRIADVKLSEAIRTVDREDVNKTAAVAQTAIANLAKQTTDLATTLAKQVTDAATATEARFSTFQSDTNKRLSALELASSERVGKGLVADPQVEAVRAAVEKLTAAQQSGEGKSSGQSNLWTMIIAGGILLVTGANFYKSTSNGQILRNERK
jgi:TolA-binding protein